jgi:hypothetical protein
MNEKFTWIYGIWYCGNKTGNWMGMLGLEEGRWVFRYRYRYYRDTKAFGSNDIKNEYVLTTRSGDMASLPQLVDKLLKAMIPFLVKGYESEIDFVDLQCPNDDPKVMFELGSRPWTNMKIEHIEKPGATIIAPAPPKGGQP